MSFNEKLHNDNLSKWYADDKKNNLRINYPLNNNSIVFDVGAYDGKWSFEIWNKYACKVYLFEPVITSFNQATNLLSKIEDIHLYNFGVGGSTREEEIILSNDGSSLFINGNNKEKITIKSMVSILESLNVNYVDLCKINIEGGEYELMEHIINNFIQDKFCNFQIQFHPYTDNYEERLQYIRDSLSRTHKLTYCYNYIWENWQLK